MNPPLVWPYCAEYVVVTTVTSWMASTGGALSWLSLVPRGVTERAAVEEVFHRPRLAPVDARVELASAEHGVAVRGHGEVARLHQEHGLGQADVAGGDDRQVLVVLLVHLVGHVGLGDVEAFLGGDVDGLRELPDLQGEVLADEVSAAQVDPRGDGGLEALEVDLHGVGPEHQRPRRVGAGVVGHEHGLDAGGVVVDGDRRPDERRRLGVGDDATDDRRGPSAGPGGDRSRTRIRSSAAPTRDGTRQDLVISTSGRQPARDFLGCIYPDPPTSVKRIFSYSHMI